MQEGSIDSNEAGPSRSISEVSEDEGLAQWQPDDWEEEQDTDEEEEEDEQLHRGIRDIPFDVLAKAQNELRSNVPSQRSSDKSGKSREDASDEEPEERSNKHAPTVMSTKKQTSRHRQAIALPKQVSRDPRFSSASGHLDQDLHSKSYSFISDVVKEEYRTAKAALSLAQKAEKTCSLRDKPMRTAERQEIERNVAQLRTKLDRMRTENREKEILSKAKREERERQAEGKGAWYMRKGEKRDLLLKARFDALEETGGKRAVKKAVDKKRKKIAGKEKKSRPDGGKRRRVES